jgi:signal transduction histidine kinase
MNPIADFFQANREAVFFVYGEAFFILGLAVALQSRKHSQVPLARHLWLLAAFGIVHGVYEWGAVFIPIQQNQLPLGVINFLRIVQLVLEAASFLVLLQFGVELIVLGRRIFARLVTLPPLIFIAWCVVVSLMAVPLNTSSVLFFRTSDALARYALGVPGALAAAWGLLQQAEQVRRMDLARIAAHFRGAAYAFAVYALLTAIVPRGDFFPASVLNYETLIETVGIPAAIFRAACGTIIAYLIIRGMEIFDVETDRLLEEAARTRAVAADRERIGRELHDGIIQSLYAAGLMLEDAALTVGEDAARAQERIRQVIGALNRTIRDIRRYILDLRAETDSGDWQNDLGELVRAFRLETLIDAEFRVEGIPQPDLTRKDGAHILTIAREALTNVSKHARATRVSVNLTYAPEQAELKVIDNGIGFSPNGGDAASASGERQGLRNMQERAQIIGAHLTIHSAPQRGTQVRLILPYAKRADSGSPYAA